MGERQRVRSPSPPRPVSWTLNSDLGAPLQRQPRLLPGSGPSLSSLSLRAPRPRGWGIPTAGQGEHRSPQRAAPPWFRRHLSGSERPECTRDTPPPPGTPGTPASAQRRGRRLSAPTRQGSGSREREGETRAHLLPSPREPREPREFGVAAPRFFAGRPERASQGGKAEYTPRSRRQNRLQPEPRLKCSLASSQNPRSGNSAASRVCRVCRRRQRSGPCGCGATSRPGRG